MDKSDDLEELLAERLNLEPVILFGYTNSEFSSAIKLTCAVMFPLALAIGLMWGRALLGLGTGFLLSMAVIVMGGKVLQRLKRGKPDFYYQTRWQLLLHRLGIKDSGLIRHHGFMSLGRSPYHRF